MARKQRIWVGYVNVHLTDKQAKEVKALAANLDALWDAMGIATVGGVKFTIGWDPTNECYVGTVLGHDHADNEGYAMSARSSNPHVALAGVYYKHAVVFSSGEWDKKILTDLIS